MFNELNVPMQEKTRRPTQCPEEASACQMGREMGWCSSDLDLDRIDTATVENSLAINEKEMNRDFRQISTRMSNIKAGVINYQITSKQH